MEEVIRLHTATDYLIYMLGFTPGFSYLGGMDERLATPRLKPHEPTFRPDLLVSPVNKRASIPLTARADGNLSAVPLKLYDPFRDPPVLLKAGNYVRFVAVTQDEYEEIAHQVKAGSYQIRQEPLSAGGRPMTPVLEVIAPGLLTTVQDRGRHCYQAFGMPVAGAVDEYAFAHC